VTDSESVGVVPIGGLIRDHLIAAKKIPAETRRRLLDYDEIGVRKSQREEWEAEGWVVERELKTKFKMRRLKAHDVAFEDRVWAALARLQFTHMNATRSFTLRYGKAENESQQIDVFAADDEVVLVVECKSTATVGKAGQFKTEVEALQGKREGLIRRIREEYPQHKVKFIFATNNYTVSDQVRERITEAQVFHIDEYTVEYYLELANHLGAAAKYQLLGALFAGDKIPNIDSKLPAIRGSMGGFTYYSFAIEPARLLKMSYVLHRNQANDELMPTYQRIIKKSRLKKVAEFVDDGGFFPNSIILNIGSGKRKGGLRFESVGKSPSEAKLGILHLPQTYRAAYIIDGQHRLYGYANSDRAETDLVPVVAFVDMPGSEQVELFMQINENQQAVPKNLQNTLNSDLLWNSEDFNERARALRLHIAQQLGDRKSSPLFNRVQLGENPKTSFRCITIEAINNGLVRGHFIGTFTKTAVKEPGTFYAGGNRPTAKLLLPFLEGAFHYLVEWLPRQAQLGNSEGGFVFINVGIEAILRILSDIVDHLIAEEGIDPLKASAGDLVDACQYYLDPLIEHLDGLSAEQGAEYRKSYGTGGRATYYRNLQLAIRDERPDFTAPGLDDYLRRADKDVINTAREIVGEIEVLMRDEIKRTLIEEYGAGWEQEGVPRPTRKKTGELANEKNLDLPPNKQVTAWDCMYFIDYHNVLTYSHDMWQARFAKQYTRPGDEQLPGSWKKRLDWVQDLNDIRNRVMHPQTQGVDDEEFDLLIELQRWLLLGEMDNDL
jgi:DNA sulfur modification protein DndB